MNGWLPVCLVSQRTFALVWFKLCDMSSVGHGLRVVSPVCLWSHHTRHMMVSTTHVTPPHHTTHVTSPPQAGTIHRSLHQMTMHMTPPQCGVWCGCRLTLTQYCIWSHRCGSAALCHRSHPSSSHQALRRPTPSLFLTKFLPLKFLTKISPDVHCIYPPIASLVFHNSLPQRRLTFGNKSRLEGTQVLHFHHSQ